MSLPSGLKVMTDQTANVYDLFSCQFGLTGVTFGRIIHEGSGRDFPLPLNLLNPIIRHMSALTEPCVQSDYNGGKPFEPHDELMKISVCDAEIKFVYTLLSNTHDRNRLLRFAPLTFVNLLIKWHFWPNMPEGESVVYVDDNFNPYK